ncbi:MAG TPA: hypothetical protein VK277_12195 [Acidimicrobiales bacterium]|nr:hypothetical protein [Acidimicrobiales bacterium]
MAAPTTDRRSASYPQATEGGRRVMAVLALVVAAVVAGYWLAWWLDRGLVAVEHRPVYVQFEDAFVLADAWLVFCLVASAFTLWTRRPTALLWLLAGGGAGLYLFGMDDLYDLQHGIWGKGGNGLLELAINVTTFVLSVAFLRWAWRRRRSLLEGPTPA